MGLLSWFRGGFRAPVELDTVDALPDTDEFGHPCVLCGSFKDLEVIGCMHFACGKCRRKDFWPSTAIIDDKRVWFRESNRKLRAHICGCTAF